MIFSWPPAVVASLAALKSVCLKRHGKHRSLILPAFYTSLNQCTIRHLPGLHRMYGDAGGGVAVVWFFSRQEIPYTHRMHVILMPVSTELSMGVATFKQVFPPPLSPSWLPLQAMRVINPFTDVSASASPVKPCRRC